MLSIRNSADISEIDIIGSIGEDWFDEGNTLDTVRNQFAQIKNDIIVNISSLGGDLIEALAIHDMFKAHPYRVSTNIIGATASAGTVIALGGDNIRISENSLFLGHKASMMVGGNAEELRAAADDLDKFDSRLIAIYKKKTGKTKAEIENWLAEDKWITAKEAKDFGLVDEVYKGSKILNTVEELSKIHELPKNYIQMENNESSLKTSILALVGFKNDEVIKAENIALRAEVDALKKATPEPVDTTIFTTEIDALKGEILAKADYDTIKAELETTKADLERAKAGLVTATAGSDPNPTGEPRKLTETEQVLANILASITEDEKMLYSKNK